ncbi:MAG: hypothetical protein ACJ8EY_07825 [Sphingomicrobium sp.]
MVRHYYQRAAKAFRATLVQICWGIQLERTQARPTIFITLTFLAAQATAVPAGAQAAPGAPASASSYGPTVPPKPQPAKPTPAPACQTPIPTEPGEVVVCAVRPNGYRIDPDVLQAMRHKKNDTRPKRPDRMVDTSCKVVGPMGCPMAPIVDFLQIAMAAGKMADRAARGESVGNMFITNPQMSEYELYVAAKREREAKEADAALQAQIRADAVEAR